MGKFILAVLKWILALGVATFVWVFVMIAVVTALVQESTPEPVEVPEKAMLVIDLGFNLVDAPVSEGSLKALAAELQGNSENRLQLRRVLDALKAAESDDRVAGIFLTGELAGSGLGNSLAAVGEFRSALADFQKRGGKPIWAYVEEDSLGSYYVKSVANTVWMDPSASVQFRGLGAEVIYWADALERLGVEVEVIRAGKYKSAGESFAASEMSPENREQLDRLISEVWKSMCEEIAESRPAAAADLQAIASELGWVMAEEALARGMVDALMAQHEVIETLIKAGAYEAEDKTFAQVSLGRYLKPEPTGLTAALSGSGNQIAVVYAEGAIVDGNGDEDQVGGDALARILRQLRQDDDVKAVVLRVNSPGGSATASAKIAREVALVNAKKPIVVSMGGYAASGGYYISAAAETILAEPTTLTGSIGVVSLILNLSDLREKLSLNVERVETNAMAGLFSPWKGLSPNERARFEAFTAKIYRDFLTEVETGREMSAEAVEAIAQGRVWSGTDALEIGLIDQLGGLPEAIAVAGDLAGIGNNFTVVDYPKARTLQDMITDLLGGNVALPRISAADAMPWATHPFFAPLAAEWRVLQGMNDPRHVYAYAPMRIVW